jgi:hypothetical protein
MFKKMLLLASMALAVVAVAAPASALGNWTHEGEPLAANANVTFSGPANFESKTAEGGAHANLSATILLEAGTTTGKVTSVSATNCTGTIKLNGITCTSTFETAAGKPVSSTDPWIVHCNPSTGVITITNIKITNHYYSPLDPSHTTTLQTTVLTGNIIATPNNREAIGTVTLAGEGTLVNGVAPATVNGDLTASPAGTYGC